MRSQTDPRSTSDRRLGEHLTRAISGLHRRRLRRLGRELVLDAPPGGWAARAPPPRPGNEVDVLIDGAEALPRIAAELERADSHVHVAGWHLSPDFALVRDGGPLVVRNLRDELAEQTEVKVLVWAGAPLPLFRPSRPTVRAVRDRLTRGTRIERAAGPAESTCARRARRRCDQAIRTGARPPGSLSSGRRRARRAEPR